jgi:hypothetical protein
MSEKIAARRSFFTSRMLKFACVSFIVGAAACVADVGDDAETFGEGEDEEVTLRAGETDLCAGQPANNFICIDDTRFQHCVGDSRIFVNSCPVGLCATRSPANQNPCVGRALAAQLDGVAPPAPATPPAAEQPPAPPPPPPPPPPVVEQPPAQQPPPAGAGGTADGRLPPRDGNTNLRAQFLDQVRQGVDGSQNVGLGTGKQFITAQCFSNADCAANADGTPTAGCARRAARAPVRTQFEGVCSGLAVCGSPGNPINGKEGCGFDQRLGR